jgi:hypothetical protein
MCTGFFGVSAASAPSPAAAANGAVIDGKNLAEVDLLGQVVVRIGASFGGLTPLGRARTVADRLTDLVTRGTQPRMVHITRVNGTWAVVAGDQVVVTVDDGTAVARSAKPKDLAFVWANNIRAALGETPLSSLDYWVPGGQAKIAETQFGVASWYGPGFRGRKTANGETFDPQSLTAAHRTLAFGTMVLVTNLANGRSVLVKINDRGPWVDRRVIDLSQAAASRLNLVDAGIGLVRLDIIR